MNEEQFWLCIERASDSDDFLGNLRGSLSGQKPEDVIMFKNILLEKMVEAYIFPLLEANFVISSYVSDDGFKEFRAWLVSKGLSKFSSAIDSPETIADWLSVDEVEGIDGGGFYYLADEVYEEISGEEIYSKVTCPAEPNIAMDWPGSKSEYQQRYPKLVAKFWNYERIRELHT